MSDNIRPMLYGARYEGILANKADAPADTTITVAASIARAAMSYPGRRHCSAGAGDILVMPTTALTATPWLLTTTVAPGRP